MSDDADREAAPGPVLREDLSSVLDAASAAWYHARVATESGDERPGPWTALHESEKAGIRSRVFHILTGRAPVRRRADQAALDVAVALGSVRVSWRGRPTLLVDVLRD